MNQITNSRRNFIKFTAAGEHEYTRWQFRDLIERAKVDILQPDLVKCAGLSEGIASRTWPRRTRNSSCPHQTQPTIGTVCNIHFATRFDNSSRAQEYNHNPEKSKLLWGIFKQSYEPRNGYMQVPGGPGLGLELDEAAMKRLVAE